MKGSLINSFVAIDVEEELKYKQLLKVQDILISQDPSLKLLKPENIHITLRFLGEIDSNLVIKISQQFDQTPFDSFNISIYGLGVFPNFRRIRVIWAGIEKGTRELGNLSYQIEKGIKKLGIFFDQWKFSPHLTIARVRSRKFNNRLVDTIKEFEDYDFGSFHMDSFELKKSVLTPKGPIYNTLQKVKAKPESK